jgi:predicted transcriptional regulator
LQVKTAVSLPDPIFRAGERLAQRLGLSRSGLYAEALREYVERHDDDEITRRLDAVYAENPAEIDPVFARVAARALAKEPWK